MKLAPSGVPYPPGIPLPPRDEVKRGGGRPTRYKKDHAHQVRMLAGKQWTNDQIAEFMQIGLTTFHRWRDAHPEFRDAILWARGDMQTLVEQALASRALGYTCNDVHISTHLGHVTKTKIKKHYAPDVGAAKFWLENQAKAKWHRDYQGDELPEEEEDPMSAEEAARIDAVLSESIDEH